MIQFFAPQNFVFLWSLPALLVLFVLAGRIRRRRLSLIGHIPTLEQKLMPHNNRSEKRLKALCFILVFLFAVLALARPQWGEEKKKVERKGVDVIFMLDTSLSMLAEDIKPSRFEKAKLEIRDILGKMKGDRVGMVAFAGSSFLQSPLTLDYAAFQLFLDAIKVGYIPDPGTSLDRALKLSIRSFPGKDTKHKAVILFTDGEDHEGGIESALEEAKKAGLRIYTIGVGTPQGEPIPLRDQTGKKSGFKKDFSGQVVVTKLNQPLLEKIAQETGGIYLPSTPGQQEIEILLKHMQSLGKKHFKEKIITEREDHYQLFLILAFLFLLLEMFVRARTVNPGASSNQGSLPSMNAFILGLIVMSSCGNLWAKDPVKLYEEKKYQSAMEEYRKKKVKDPDDPAVRYNLGTTLYQIDNFSDASKELEKTVAATKDPALKAKAYYNYGNAQYRLGNFEKAIESYKKALELNPADKDAKYNLEFLQKKKSSFEKQNQQRQNQKQDQQQKEQDQKQQQNQNQQQQNQQQNQQNQEQDQQQQNQNQQQQNQQQNQNQQGQQDSEQQNQDKQDNQQQQNQQNPEEDPQSQDREDQQQQDQQKEDQQEQQDQQKKPDQGDQEQDQQQEPSQENPQDQQKPEEGQQEPAEIQPQGMGGEEPLPAQETPEPQQQGKQPLQGQMSLENALQILEALKEGEKEMHDLRKPGAGREQARVVKDW